MAHKTPQFNIKTGADSSLFFSRETTSADKSEGKISPVTGEVISDDEVGLIQDSVPDGTYNKDTASYENVGDYYSYPVLTRRTGHSITGSTESIESSELRKGRTKSAPRKGSSSSSGDLEFELSPETYDDIFEAAFRGKWTPWASDTDSATNIVEAGEVKPTYEDNYFATALGDPLGKNGVEHPSFKLLGKNSDSASEYLIRTDEEVEIHELCCGTEDIKYSALAQYGGITGEDLYQEFEHLAVNTMSLSVSPGEIVTGSFGFMGSNDPDLLQTGEVYPEADPQPTAKNFSKGTYYTRSGTAGAYTYTKATTFVAGTTYYSRASGLVKSLADVYEVASTQPTSTNFENGKYYTLESDGSYKYASAYTSGKTYYVRTQEGRFLSEMTPEEVKKWIANLPEKGTSTDQYTAREGFLYVAGKRVQYGSNLDFSLDNGLKQIFAIFEKDAISTAPMTLDITGTLDAYLIKDHAEVLYNLATQDKDVELLFCFQDKEDDPTAMYVMQIFKTKFDKSISNGSEELTVSLLYTSFEERAARMFRIRKRKPIALTCASDIKTFSIELSTANSGKTADDYDVTITVDGVDETDSLNVALSGDAYGKTISWTCDGVSATSKDQTVVVTVEYNGIKKSVTRVIEKA
jgi:hypothetical protein